VRVRRERPGDIAAIRAVHEAAFETTAEAALVDRLRTEAWPLVSLVADDEVGIVGHILFSPVAIEEQAGIRVAGLAPVAVLPAHQRRGVGAALVRAGLEACVHAGFDAVVVVGHASYYPRFEFRPASQFGLRCEYDVPDDVFMALELRPGALAGRSGTVRYHPAFRDVSA
jgi:putative acetyltransferase